MKIGLHIKASTIVELLVTMIVSSIVLVSIMDGFRVVQSYVSGQSVEVGGNWEFYNDYQALSGLLNAADSVRDVDNSVMVYQSDRISTNLAVVDSALIISGDVEDTLLNRVVSCWVKSELTDTLFVDVITNRGENLNLSFVVEPSNRFRRQVLINDEAQYEYK